MCTDNPDEFAGRRATPEEHLQESDSLRDAAKHCMSVGKLGLASEAYWGMVAHILQAIAERRGMRHISNLDFRVIMDWLVGETGNEQLKIWFQRTYRLHQNFYRIIMTPEEIEARSESALALADAARPFAT